MVSPKSKSKQQPKVKDIKANEFNFYSRFPTFAHVEFN